MRPPVIEPQVEPVPMGTKNKHDSTRVIVDGWIAPDGTFYGCDYYAHDVLADAIVGAEEYGVGTDKLDHAGWIHASHCHYITPLVPVTQKQLDTYYDWTRLLAKEFPWQVHITNDWFNRMAGHQKI